MIHCNASVLVERRRYAPCSCANGTPSLRNVVLVMRSRLPGPFSFQERPSIMATNILDVHAQRDELRKRLTIDVNDYHRMCASDISGPGLALDFGHVGGTWGQIKWNDNTGTWDVAIGDGPVHKAKTVDDAVAHCTAAGRERAKRLP